MTVQKQFFGTAQAVIASLPSNLANGGGYTGVTFDNTVDVVVPYALFALATLEIPDFSTAPFLGKVDLWGALKNTDGSEDDTNPPVDAFDVSGGKFFGEWVMDDVDALQRRTILISLEGIEKVSFCIVNNSSATLFAGTSLLILPMSYGVIV